MVNHSESDLSKNVIANEEVVINLSDGHKRRSVRRSSLGAGAHPYDVNEQPEAAPPAPSDAPEWLYPIRAMGYGYREYLGEFLGTTTLILLGLGVCAQFKLFTHSPDSTLAVCFGWGLALLCAIYVARTVSGAHLNPAVTITLCVFRRFPAHKVPGYILAQCLGAFCGAALVFANFRPAFDHFDGGVRQSSGEFNTGGIFYDQSLPFVAHGNHFVTEVISTAFLLIAIFAFSDKHNNPDAGPVTPIALSLVLVALLMNLGYPSGLSLNPARDLGPRIFLSMVGYGSGAFTNNDSYAWVPILAPIVGGLVGGFLYDVLIISSPPTRGDQVVYHRKATKNSYSENRETTSLPAIHSRLSLSN